MAVKAELVDWMGWRELMGSGRRTTGGSNTPAVGGMVDPFPAEKV
jgi:hypothetical protein